MPKNFYNLPPSWNPGYAIPPSVMDENLERHAFTTLQAPRGTYDNPKVSNHGYAVPQYVDEEGYGRGVFNTKWLPRGFIGPDVPHWLDKQFATITGQASLGRGKGVVIAMQTPMGDDTAVPYSSSGANLGVFGTFGQRGAAALITAAKRYPASQRSSAMKAMMDKIDPTLHARAGRCVAKARAQGVAPGPALAHGIAAAMTEGMLGELHKVGKSRTAPQPRSLLGLGCYGALGATDTAFQIAPPQSVTVNVSADGTKFNMPVTCPGYSWTGSSWTITRVGARDVPGPAGISCPGRVDHTQGDAVGAGGAPADFSAQKVTDHTILQVGPFSLPANARAVAVRTTMTPEQTAFIQGSINALKVSGMLPNGLSIMEGRVPFVKFRFPKSDSANSGKLFGLFAKFGTGGITDVMWKEYVPDTGPLGALWNALKEVAAFLVDVVKTAIEFVGDLACGTVSAPGAAGAAAAASGGAAAVGVAITAGICGGNGTPPPPAPSSSSSLLPLAILGGGALVIIALNKKKKASTP